MHHTLMSQLDRHNRSALLRTWRRYGLRQHSTTLRFADNRPKPYIFWDGRRSWTSSGHWSLGRAAIWQRRNSCGNVGSTLPLARVSGSEKLRRVAKTSITRLVWRDSAVPWLRRPSSCTANDMERLSRIQSGLAEFRTQQSGRGPQPALSRRIAVNGDPEFIHIAGPKQR